jgi:hypothetical protein
MNDHSICSLRSMPAVIVRHRAMNSRMTCGLELAAMPEKVKVPAQVEFGCLDGHQAAAPEGLAQARREMQPMPRPNSTARLIASVCSSSSRICQCAKC